MRRSRMRCLRFEHRSNTRRTGYRSKAGSETRTMAVSLGRSDVPGAQYGVLTESPGSRDVSGSVLAPKPTKKSTVAGGLDASLRRYFWRLYRQRNLWPAKSGRKYAFPGCLCRNNAQNESLVSKNTLETTLETVKARKNTNTEHHIFGPPMSDEYVAHFASVDAELSGPRMFGPPMSDEYVS